MFARKIHHKLLNWKNKANRKPLILRGARQVGKSTLAHNLGKEYKHYIHLNLEKHKDAEYFRAYGDDVQSIIEAILLENNIPFELEKTLLFIDEIQEEPKAIALLRYFYEELPDLHVISAGSLLEFALSEVSSFPVGRVEQLAIHPMDFEEFLMALGEDRALEYYCQMPIPEVSYNKLFELFHQYIMVGGMPEIVQTYVEHKRSLSSLTNTYSSIWDVYKDDIEKYGTTRKDKTILRHIINTAPSIRDRITFAGFGNSQYTSRDIAEGVQKLHKAGIVKLIYPTNDTALPLTPNLRRKPKIQFLDTGLLNYAAGLHSQMLNTRDFNTLYKGYITNHIVLQELIAQSDIVSFIPTFWTRENANSNAEVDVLYAHQFKAIPIEIKSGASGRLRSLHEFIDRADHTLAIRLLANHHSFEQIQTRTKKKYTLVNLPYFCIGRISEWLDWINEEL